jgi:hypothetical protein
LGPALFFLRAGASIRDEEGAVRRKLVGGEKFLAAGAALGAKACPTLDFARLLVEFANPHFFLDAASLDQLSKTADSLLGRFLVTQRQLDHTLS